MYYPFLYLSIGVFFGVMVGLFFTDEYTRDLFVPLTIFLWPIVIPLALIISITFFIINKTKDLLGRK